MIYLTRLNGKIFYINAELIQLVEATPDTVVTLTNDAKYIVRESPEEVIDKIVHYRRRIYHPRLVSEDTGE